ncbi:hypothetical protein GCM10009544_38740 [Streptomyces stramineus]|uniref:Uncharacterized protein n=1 Tax=Streptomyces stramineus TaxID=173861 RepID=A0ABN1ACD8_9ACTN
MCPAAAVAFSSARSWTHSSYVPWLTPARRVTSSHTASSRSASSRVGRRIFSRCRAMAASAGRWKTRGPESSHTAAMTSPSKGLTREKAKLTTTRLISAVGRGMTSWERAAPSTPR